MIINHSLTLTLTSKISGNLYSNYLKLLDTNYRLEGEGMVMLNELYKLMSIKENLQNFQILYTQDDKSYTLSKEKEERKEEKII